MKTLSALCFAAVAVGTMIVPAQAQSDWPAKPVRIIVPFGAGGSADTLARVVASELEKTFKQSFIVENRPGAGGTIGVQALAAAAPDGYTVGMTNISTLSLAPVINKAVAYDPLKDFTHIAYVGGAPVVLSASRKIGVNTLDEFLAYAKKRSFTFASSGLGSDGHLMGEAIALATEVKPEHVPYKNTGQALTDLVAGHVPFATFTLSSTAQFLRADQVKGLAVTSDERLPAYSNVPTFKELGHPDLVGTTWFSLSGPAKLPAQIADKLNKAIQTATADPAVQERFRRDGFVTEPFSPAEFTAFVAKENARWLPLIKSSGLAGTGG